MSGATSPEAETIIRQSAEINRLMDQSASRIDRVQRSLDAAWGAQQRFDQAQNSINSALERGRISQERANQLLDLNKQRLEQATRATNNLANANDNAARGSRNFGGVIGQAGFQVQDFAVQIASGQSALTAFIQQGSQLAGAFGAGGAIVGAGLAIAGIIVQLAGAKTATDALNDAIERQRDLYTATTDAAERYREGQEREAQNAQRLTAYYASMNNEMRQAERLRLATARADLMQTQANRAREATSRLGDLDVSATGGVAPGMPLAESMMAGIGGPGALPASMRDAAEAVRQFRAQGVFTAQAIDELSNRLYALAQANAGSSAAIMRQRQELEAARPQLIEAQRALEQNAAAHAALEGNARGAAQALGGVGAAAQAQLQPLRDLVRDLDKVNSELSALRSGGLAGLEQQRRSRTVMERAQRDLDQDVAERVRRGASPADARAQALDQTPMADRIGEATRLVETQRQVTETTERLEKERRDAEAAARRAQRQGETAARREERLTERTRRERDQLISSLDEEAAANIRLEESLKRIDEARRRNLLTEEEATRYSQLARSRREQDIVRANDKSQMDAEQTKRIAELTNELGDIMGETFRGLVREGKSFSDVLDNIQERLLRLGDKYLLQPLLDQMAQLAVSSLGGGGGGMGGGAGGILGTLLGRMGGSEIVGTGIAKGAEVAMSATVLHGGGVAGVDGGRRLVPAEVFLDAPRYHSGAVAAGMRFANDEVPAVLKRKEVVLTEGQQAAVRREMGGRTTIINQIHTPGADSFRKSGGQVGADLARSTQRALARSA